MGLGGIKINPAPSLGAGAHIQACELGHTQTDAVEQLYHGGVARFQFGRGGGVLAVGGQLHRIVHPERFRQGFGCFGRTHIGHRVAVDQALPTQPGVKTPPARQNQGNAPTCSALGVHLGHPTANMGVVHLSQG